MWPTAWPPPAPIIRIGPPSPHTPASRIRARSLLDALGALTADQPHPRLTRHHSAAACAGKTVFVLPGQGAQYPGMGLELYQHHRSFARALDECDQALRPWTGWSVRDVLSPGPGGAGAGSRRCGAAGVVCGDGVAGRGVGLVWDCA